MIEVILLAIALAMDAFAVSIGLGAKTAAKPQNNSQQKVRHLAIYSALYFGVAQGVMPLFGYLLGVVLLGWLATAAPWIGGSILIILGGKMLYEVFLIYDKGRADDNENTMLADAQTSAQVFDSYKTINHKTMFTLAIATSIDAMAAGFTLNLLSMNAWLACLLVALITAAFSWLGVYLGNRSGTWLEDKAEALGGIVLITIGLKVMFFS